MPLSNHISGPIGNSQSESSNSTNTTTWTFTSDNNINPMVDYDINHYKHLQSFLSLYGSKYQSQIGINFNSSILNSVQYYTDNSVDNNSTNVSCHNSHLGSVVGKNSVKRIPARVWLTISGILTMSSIGKFV